MVHLFRKNQKTLTLLITILVIIAFVWLYNSTQFEKIGKSTVARVYGRGVSHAEIERRGKRYDLAAGMGLFQYVQMLSALGPEGIDPRENFALSTIVLEHEAEALGIAPTSEQIAAEIRQMEPFQTNGQFDFQKYTEFTEQNLAPRGFTESALEEVVANSLRLQRIQKLLGATAAVSPARLRAEYGEGTQKRTAGVIRVQLADLEAEVKVTDEDVNTAYEERKETYQTAEKRAVEYVAFAVGEEVQKLPREEQIPVLQKAADRAGDFSTALAEGGTFEEVAAKMEVEVKKTEPFAQQAPPEALARVRGAGEAAFSLSEEKPSTDPLTGVDGFYILHLAATEPARPLALEEARPQIVEDLKSERAREMLQTKVAEARPKIEAALKVGKPLAEVARELGLTAETFPEFSLNDWPREAPDAGQIVGTAAELPQGALSQFVPTPAGGVLVYVEKVEPIDEEKFEKEKGPVAERMAQRQEIALLFDWLRIRRAVALPETPANG